MAFSSVEDLNKMKSRTLSVILRTKRNVNKNEYGRAEKFMARLRAEQGEKEGGGGVMRESQTHHQLIDK